MRHLLTLTTFALSLIVCMGAKADSIFQINGTTAMAGASFYGIVTIDSLVGSVSYVDIFYTGGLAGTATVEMNYIGGQAANFGNGPGYELVAHDTPYGSASLWEIDLLFRTPTLVNFAGTTLCTSSDPCDGDYTAMNYLKPHPNSYDNLQTGSIAAAAVTPELSSLSLVCTGMLGVFGIMWSGSRRLHLRSVLVTIQIDCFKQK